MITIALDQTSSRGSQEGEQKKVIVMFGLIALLAGYWGYKLTIGRQPKKSPPARAQEAPARATAAEAVEAIKEAISKPLAQAESGLRSPRAEAPETILLKALPMYSRDPFSVSDAMAKLMVKPEPVAEVEDSGSGEAGETSLEEDPGPTMKLEGTIIDGSTRYALIDGEVVVVGQTLHDMKVTEIHEREVVLEAPAGALRLAVE